MNNTSTIKSRKEEHVNLALKADVQVKGATNGFEDFLPVPIAVPDMNFDNISLTTKFLGRTFDAPILVAGMTGGYPKAKEINQKLAKVCAKLNIPMGVGSQRAMIINPDMIDTFDVKAEVPEVFLLGNLGLVQFCLDFGQEQYEVAQEKIKADAMAIHVNSFQELCQPEGDLTWKGSWNSFEEICKYSKVPVVGKEVGSGIPWEEAARMEKIGCSAVDVGGSGGTSWAKLELMRNVKDDALDIEDPTLEWGITTALATYEATKKLNIPVISTGGMYHGLAAAKALMMGTTLVGIARPVLQALIDGGEEQAEKYLSRYLLNIKRVMFLSGIDNLDEFRKQKNRLIPTGRAKDWLSHRGFI
jgi:isopentenyl-diphosphate Delta-isomerase